MKSGPAAPTLFEHVRRVPCLHCAVVHLPHAARRPAHRRQLPPALAPPQLHHVFFRSELRSALSIFSFVLVVGLALGLAFPPSDPTYPEPWRRLSGVIGWIYFTAWSLSFWPQVFINYRRRSVVGLSFEFPSLNLVGFSCYTAYNCALFWNPTIRAQYAAANDGALPSVQSNDVFFGIHAVAVTALTLAQIAVYEKGEQRLARWCIVVLIALGALIGVAAAVTAARVAPSWTWLDYLIFLSYVKLSITLMKYFPQAILNWRRKSTVGWSIDNILLDFTGGTLSLAQSLMDNGIKGQWVQIFGGNPAKFFLGFTSMVFDVVFMTQHYCLYKENNARIAAEEEEARGGYATLNATALNDAT